MTQVFFPFNFSFVFRDFLEMNVFDREKCGRKSYLNLNFTCNTMSVQRTNPTSYDHGTPLDVILPRCLKLRFIQNENRNTYVKFWFTFDGLLQT